MTAVLQSAAGNSDRVAQAIAECNRLGIRVMQPDVNRSGVNFTIEMQSDGSEAIRYGLAQVKNVGLGGVEGLIGEREAKGEFESIEDFARRVNPHDVNKRVLDSLAKAGAFDSLVDRGAVITGVDRLASLAQQEQRLRDTGQTSMFDLFGDEVNTPLPVLELETVRIPQPQLLAWEKELLGTYISDHPFQAASKVLSRHVTHQCVELTNDLAGQDAIVAGLVVGIRALATKQGKSFAAVTIEDLSGQTEVTLWSEAYERLKEAGVLFEGNILLLKVNVRQRGDRVSAGVFEACAYDQEAARLINFDASKFQPRTSGARNGWQQRAVAERSVPYQPDGGPNGGGPNGGNRAHLSIVPRDPEAAATPAPLSAPQRVESDGPRRLQIEMEETTDEAADLRRVRKLCALLDEFEGDLPVVLCVKTRAGAVVRLERGGVAPHAVERIVPRTRSILGVLGQAYEAGREEAAVLAATGG